jgi:phosphatidylethanolamine-binding protein (PEBP) family uncharacterized protein
MKKSLKITSCAVMTAALVACDGGGGGGGGSTTACSDTTAFCVYSPSVAEGAALPLKFASTHATGGQNVNPALEIKNVPAAAVYLSAVMDDETTPECGTGMNACVHAGVFDLPKTKVSMSEGESLSSISGVLFGATVGGNGYEGPFPPPGVNHTYKMTVYAHKSAWTGYSSTARSGYPLSRAEVLADHGPSGDNDIVDSKTITFTFVGR